MTIARTLACLAVCGLAATSATAEPSVVEKGRHALETRCSRCHAIGLEGASAHPEAPPFREVVKRYPPESLEESLAEGITSGHPDMPEFILSPDEIFAVVAFLHTLEQR
jgi:mono/diheme cytochrome c family protein